MLESAKRLMNVFEMGGLRDLAGGTRMDIIRNDIVRLRAWAIRELFVSVEWKTSHTKTEVWMWMVCKGLSMTGDMSKR